MNLIKAVDLFCGAGRTSTGLYNACHSIGKNVDLLAINHWQTAIDTHSANHPGARHICATLDSIRPESVIKSGRLNIMVASPECTHHSVARGGGRSMISCAPQPGLFYAGLNLYAWTIFLSRTYKNSETGVRWAQIINL